MPNQPNRQDVHIDRPLTNVITAYWNADENYIADKVFKIIPVDKQSNLYRKYDKAYTLRTGAAKRAPNTESAGGGFKLSYGRYVADKWSWHMDVTDEDRANADEFDLFADAGKFCLSNIKLRREALFVARYMTAGKWKGLVNSGVAYDFSPNVNGVSGSTYGFGNGFWKSSTSTPITDIDSLINLGASGTGQVFNTLVLTADVWFALKNHPTTVDRIKYGATPGSPAVVTEQAVAAMFGVKNLYVVRAVLNSAQEGQVANIGYLASNAFLLCYVPDTVSLYQPSSGYIFQWTAFPGASSAGIIAENIRMPLLHSTRIEATTFFDMNMVGSDLGILGTNVLF